MLITLPVLNVSSGDAENKVLVVEDNHETQLIFKIYLREKYSVEIKGTAEEALEALSKDKYNAVILDINLPGKFNGSDVLREIRNNKKLDKLPVIMVSAYEIDGDSKKYLESGANDYISKPVQKNTLLSKIDALLQ